MNAAEEVLRGIGWVFMLVEIFTFKLRRQKHNGRYKLHIFFKKTIYHKNVALSY